MKSAGNQVLLKQYPHSIIIALNTYTEPFSNPKAREALQYAIDRDKMTRDLLNNVGAPAYQWMYKGHPWYNADFGMRICEGLRQGRTHPSPGSFLAGLSQRERRIAH